MKKLNIKNILLAGAVVALVAGCGQVGPKAKKGAVIGAASGAVITGVAGGSGRSIATGAVVGGVIGGVIGDSQDKKDQ